MDTLRLANDELNKDTDVERRKARNRIAQRNYRKNIKDRLRELDILRARETTGRPLNVNQIANASSKATCSEESVEQMGVRNHGRGPITPQPSDSLCIGEDIPTSHIQSLQFPARDGTKGSSDVLHLDWTETPVLPSPPSACNLASVGSLERDAQMEHPRASDLDSCQSVRKQHLLIAPSHYIPFSMRKLL
ncbi:hypothetical protein L228DRAFT_183061 [Xylona heveae TC161]|uniref:BZIP domain-containing protein n=1 Tax=Xylona heveae (strain CBS 132557 / TC161) TaxID=1328760 RepID=A0A165FGS1_XYLHT|nr:hypothetical protein L228DRAFT_183061 [Xylona heveae TC161]KZF20959.1 hypothetical protein L228DRAFT_183061 [Xylona heveae TC161]